MMKIRYILEVTITMVSYKTSCYERHKDERGNVTWFLDTGESLETVYDDEELEKVFINLIGEKN